MIVIRTDNQLSRQTRQNIKLCFDDLNSSQQHELVKKSIHHTCCTFTELAAVWHQPIDKILNQITSQNIDSQFQRSNKSKIIIAPHHGCWELLNLWLAQQGNLFTLYKPAKKQSLNDYLLRKRTLNGATLVAANTSGLRAILKGLKKNASCMILPDQKPAKKTAKIDADFFNHTASTTLLIKNLALKSDCEIYIAAITRNLDKADYTVTIKQLQRDNFIADDQHSANYLNQSIENFVTMNISQYQWAYRRFSGKDYAKLEGQKSDI